MKQLIYIALLTWPLALFALPTGEEVVSGEADFARLDSQTCIITPSDKSIIEYSRFDIGQSEHVQFVQPSKESTVLNRVMSTDPSAILGRLSANGKVFFVNPNGVYFGPDARVDVGSLVVSTLDIRDQDFLVDNYFFQNPIKHSSIVNDGNLHAESHIVLMAPHLRNSGVVTADLGSIAMLSGDKVTLDFTGDGLIGFAVEAEEIQAALIEQMGELKAQNGQIALHLPVAGAVLKGVLNCSHVVEGNTVVEEGGGFRLIHTGSSIAQQIMMQGEDCSVIDLQGTVSADREIIGGPIDVYGQVIHLRNLHLSSCGNFGGGRVYIGGGFRGQGDQYQSQELFASHDVTIHANAVERGDGGNVVLWSKGNTFFCGTIYAQGGKTAGNGGIVETSGLENLGCSGSAHVNTLASIGKRGIWLVDPLTIQVVLSGGSTDLATAASCSSSTTLFKLDSSAINTAASDVFLCGKTLLQDSDAPINMVNAVNLNLQFPPSQISPGTLGLESTIATPGDVNVIGGPFNLSQPLNITSAANINIMESLGGGDVSLNATNNVTFTNSQALSALEDVVINGNDININGANPLSCSRIQLTANSVTTTTPITAAGSGNAIVVNAPTANLDKLTTTSSSGSIVVQAAMAATLKEVSSGGGFSALLGGTITLTDAVTANNGDIQFLGPVVVDANITLDTSSASRNILFDQQVTSSVGGAKNLSLNSGSGDITANSLVGNASNPLGELNVINAKDVDWKGNVEVGTYKQQAQTSGGSTAFDGTLTATNATATAIDFVGESLHWNENVMASHDVSVTANTTWALASGKTFMIDGKTTFLGAGKMEMGSAITSNTGFDLKGPVVLTNTITLTTTGGNIEISGTMDGTTAYTEAITFSPGMSTVAGQSGINISGAVGGTTPLGAVSIPTCNTCEISGNCSALSFTQTTGTSDTKITGGLQLGGDLKITNNANIAVAEINTTQNSANGNVELQPATGFTTSPTLGQIPNGILTVRGNMTTGTGSVTLSGASRSIVSGTLSIASIVNDTSNSITIDCNGFTVGPNEIFTSFGPLTITSQNQIRLGDTVAIGEMTLFGKEGIVAMAHDVPTTLSKECKLVEGRTEGIQLVSSKGISLNVSPEVVGSGSLKVKPNQKLTSEDLQCTSDGKILILNAVDTSIITPINIPIKIFFNENIFWTSWYLSYWYPDFLYEESLFIPTYLYFIDYYDRLVF